MSSYGSMPPSPDDRPGGQSPGPSGEPYGQQPYGQQPYSQYGYGQPAAGGPPITSMGKRFLARLVDFGIFLAIYGVLFLALGIGGATQLETDATGQVTEESVAAFTGATLLVTGFLALVALLYEVVFVALKGATPGKMALGIKVVPENGPIVAPGWGPSILRWLIPFVGSFVCGIGQLVVYLSPFFDSSGRRQGWHDKVAKTLVVDAKGS